MTEFVIAAIEKYPVLVTIFAVIGVLRVINKPLFSFLRTFVSATQTTADDQLLDTAEKSKVYKAICYLLDLTASIKVPLEKK